jgi:hypothetical protein
MFRKYIIKIKLNTFEELSKCIEFENVSKGKMGAVLVDHNYGLVPIIRTTTNYNKPAQIFLHVHRMLIDKIKKKIKDIKDIKDIAFNNALMEIYDCKYRKMGFHTDQSLDLKEDSYICLFSCYENNLNNVDDIRKLKIKNKITKECSEVLLTHNSVVLFSTSTNHNHLHKIVLDSDTSKNRWLGITFRLSKTFVKFVGDIPYIHPSNKILRIANNNEKKEFFKHKGNENSRNECTYPEINYTLSISDTLHIV